jgi:PBP1b-binding outer membrane lipoprotein LpoB
VRVKECNTRGVDAALPGSPVVRYNRLSTPNIHHIETVNAVVGRVELNHTTWAIVDRSRNGARTHFVDEDDEELD